MITAMDGLGTYAQDCPFNDCSVLRDKISCNNALYFDGNISCMYPGVSSDLGLNFSIFIVVTKNRNKVVKPISRSDRGCQPSSSTSQTAEAPRHHAG